MLHYLPKVLSSKYTSHPVCREILLKEKIEMKEFSDQSQPIEDILGLEKD